MNDIKMAVFHGFEELRYKKPGSLRLAVVIVVMFFLSDIFSDRLSGFQFHNSYDKIFNIIPYITRTVVLFMAWTIGNSAVSVFLDGDGKTKNIAIYSAYSLVPFIAQRFINTLLSHFLIQDEIIFMQIISIVGTSWTAVLLFSAIKSVHQYSFIRTTVSIIMTVFAMAIMLFLLILMMSLVQQMWLFIESLYTEILYRVRV